MGWGRQDEVRGMAVVVWTGFSLSGFWRSGKQRDRDKEE